MKKHNLLFILLFQFLIAFPQEPEPVFPLIKGDTMVLTSGYKIGIGQDVKIGTGSMPNGDFKFITFSRGNWVSSMNGDYSTDYLGAKWKGHVFKVKRFQKYGTKKRGFMNYLILGGGNIVNYECDIEGAVESGEIEVPKEFRKNSQNSIIVNQQLSVGDEIMKLKKLLDEKIITQEEFDAQKKKLLSGN